MSISPASIKTIQFITLGYDCTKNSSKINAIEDVLSNWTMKTADVRLRKFRN